MERKEYDLFVNILSNPQSSLDNLITSGLSIDNTSLQDKSVYENNDKVREQFKDQYGEFDKTRFDAAYNNAKVYYNYLAQTDFNKAMEKQATFHRSNMYVDPEQKRQGPDFFEVKVANPYHITQGLVAPGISGERTRSIDELAQAHKVLLNPTTAGDNLENAQWGDAPNDNFSGYFFDTLVLAQYDNNDVHKDPITGEIVQHKVGDLKLDDTGNFYYERLDGRDIYGRRVLNKGNVITTDGSWANQFDFFDVDDIQQKSAMGSIMRNLALVGSMWLPYVGPWIAGISIATQLAGLLGTMGKMIAGSNSPTFSALEGWSKSMSRQGAATEYAQQHPWCMENMINLFGDVMGQLKEQRFIFTKVPTLFKGSPMIDATNEAARKTELVDKYRKLLTTELATLEKNGASGTDLLKFSTVLEARAISAAQAEMDSFIKGYNKLGEIISRGYMTGITVGDTYGEAKQAGASDMDATLLTIGYALGEYQLLKTGLGRWNIPETRLDTYRNQAIAKALFTAKQEAEKIVSTTTKEGKKAYVQKLLNAGKSAFNDVWTASKANGSKTLSATLTSAAGEGIEEMSEELLADFSKGCYDVVKWLQGDDIRLNTFGYDFSAGKWDSSEIRDRYLLSLVGGAVGGGLTNVVTNYKMINSYNNMDNKQAIEQLVYMARNGGLDQFMKDVSKMTLDNPNLSTDYEIINNEVVFNPGTRDNNRDINLKKAIQNQVNIIQSILSANGAVSDNQFLDSQTLGDLRLVALQRSTTAGAYIQEYNSLLTQIAQDTNTLSQLTKRDLDTNGDGQVSDAESRHNEVSTSTEESIKKLQKSIKENKQKLDDLVSGKRAVEFIATALWETTSFLSGNFIKTTFPLYAEWKYGKKFKDLTEEEKAQAADDYKNWKTTTARDELQTMALNFLEFEKQFSKVVKNHEQTYLSTSKELQQITESIDKLNRQLLYVNDANKLQTVQERVSSPDGRMSDQVSLLGSDLISILGTDEQKAQLEDIRNRRKKAAKVITEETTKEEASAIHQPFNIEQQKLVYDTLATNLHSYVQEILNRGFANKETKNQIVSLLSQVRTKILPPLIYNRNIEIEASMDYDSINEWEEMNNVLFNDIRDIEALNNTPLEQNLNEFSISIGQNPLNLTQLIEKVNRVFNDTSENISNFQISDVAVELENAIQTLELYSAAIKAARTDSANLSNLFGFNATLNEASAKVDGAEKLNLAEIDHTVADLFLEDINVNLNKLKLLKKINALNTGQKLSKQERVSTKKDLLVYKRLKYIISILDKLEDFDKESVKQLDALLQTQKLHNELLDSNGVTVKDQEAFQRENIAIEDAIYDFFQTNKSILEDPTKLAKLLSPNNLDLYTKADELLNEDLEALDDNSFVWWLASRVAVKSSDFYFQYQQIINPEAKKPLAPIATQELAIYNNYASIVNGNVFTNFYNAMRIAIIEDWQNKSESKRKEVLRKLGKPEIFSRDNLAKFALSFLPAPRYSNIMLTEGVPGSGKSTGVFKSTIELIRKFHPELLKDVIVAHGANPTSATSLQTDIGLTASNSKSFGREDLMKYIRTNWRDYVKNKDNIYVVPNTDYEITSEGEIKSNLGINDNIPSPSLIIIDEISKFTAYDLDLIDKFAQTHGITVLVAGDFDQSGVVGEHKIPRDHAFDGLVWKVSLDRTNFLRAPKLGVSMRTDNTLKTNNLIKTQVFLQNPQGQLELEYSENENGLFGDHVIEYGVEVARNNQNDVLEVISDKDGITSQILSEVDKLASTLKEGEKIGYIFSNKNSKLYQELEKRPYIELFEGDSAQGLEGRYYIVDLNFSIDTNTFLKSLYTGISRAQQGSLIITPTGKDKSIVNIHSTLKTEVPIKEPLSREAIAKFSKNRKEILSKVVPSGKVPDIVPRTNTKPVQSPPEKELGQGVDQEAQRAALEAAMNAEKQLLLQAISQAQNESEINQLITNSKYAQLGSDPDILNAKSQRIDQLSEVIRRQDFIRQVTADILKAKSLDDLDTIIQLAQEQYPDIMQDIESYYNTRKEEINTANTAQEEKNNYVISVLEAIQQAKSEAELDDIISKAEIQYPGIIAEYGLQKDFDQIREVIKQANLPVPDTHQPAPDPFDDDISPVTDNDIVDTTTYKKKIDDNNEDTFIPESSVEESSTGKPIPIQMCLHSFNTFETGVLEGEHGEAIQIGDQKRLKHRIDSVNGLIKIDTFLGVEKQSFQEYVNILGELRSIVFNTENKADLDKAIQDYFGFSNIYTTFALKSSLRKEKGFQTDDDGYSRSSPNPYEKSTKEKTLFNGSTDTFSKEVNNKSLVLIIGTKETGNILELPLLTLSSPFTIIQMKNSDGQLVFSEVYNVFKQLADQQNPNWEEIVAQGGDPNLNLVDISTKLIQQFENSIEYKELIDLFKLFLMTGNWIKYIRNTEWTPSKNLELTGAHVVNKKGYYQLEDGLRFNSTINSKEEWISVVDFAGTTNWNDKVNPYHNPQTYVTPIFIATDVKRDGDLVLPIHKGHPFVLVSYDTSLNNDSAVIDQYIEQVRDPSKPKKVVLMYILPPEATMDEYCTQIDEFINGSREFISVGYFPTIFKLLKGLTYDENNQLRDNDVVRLIRRKLGNLAPKLLNALERIPLNASTQELKQLLNQTEDWSSEGLGKGPETLTYLFRGALYKLSQIVDLSTGVHSKDADAIKILQKGSEELGITLYHHFPIPKNDHNSFKGFIIPSQNNYSLEDKPCLIHGKVDSYTFKGHMGWLISELMNARNLPDSEVDPLSPTANNRWRTPDNPGYYSGNSNLEDNPIRTKRDKENHVREKAIKSIIDHVLDKTSITIDPKIFEGKTIDQAQLEIADMINSTNGDNIAFILNNRLFISTSKQDIQGNNKIIYSNGQPITDITNIVQINGETSIQLSIDGKTYDGIINTLNNTIEIWEPKTATTVTAPTLSITPDTFVDYSIEAKSLLTQVFRADKKLAAVFDINSYDEFIQALLALPKLGPAPGNKDITMREFMIQKVTDGKQLSSLQQQIVNDLLTMEQYKKQMDKNDLTICPVKIKILF